MLEKTAWWSGSICNMTANIATVAPNNSDKRAERFEKFRYVEKNPLERLSRTTPAVRTIQSTSCPSGCAARCTAGPDVAGCRSGPDVAGCRSLDTTCWSSASSTQLSVVSVWSKPSCASMTSKTKSVDRSTVRDVRLVASHYGNLSKSVLHCINSFQMTPLDGIVHSSVS